MSCPRIHMHGKHCEVCYAKIAVLLLKVQFLQSKFLSAYYNKSICSVLLLKTRLPAL